MHRIAVIDLGTNTFNLLIADVLNNTSKIIYTTKIPVRLGQGGLSKNRIEQDAFERGIYALIKYRKLIDKHRVDRVFAFATSAIRGAINKNEFIEMAKEQAKINIEAITGEREADLIYKGVKHALKIGEQPELIMDIGGGSTEFIIANDKNLYWKYSFLLGVSRLMEKFNPSDPIKEEEVSTIENYLETELKPLFDALKQNPVNTLIGSSGSFDSFAEIISNKYHSTDILKDKTEYTFNLNECEVVFEEMLRSTKKERLAIKGLIEMRVDMIVLSALLVKFVLKKTGIKNMRLSTYSLKEGVMWELINN